MSDGLPSEDELESGTVVAAPLEAHDLPPDFLPRPAAVGLRPFLGQTTSAGQTMTNSSIEVSSFVVSVPPPSEDSHSN